MITQIQVVPLKVTDLDQALAFYTEKVGLAVGADITTPDGYRWLTVKVPGTAYPEIVLMQAAAEDIVTGPGGNGLVFHSEDCAGTHQELTARGLAFTEAPAQQPWGVQATFADPDGNQHIILQPVQMPA